jgi:hypothetical protein
MVVEFRRQKTDGRLRLDRAQVLPGCQTFQFRQGVAKQDEPDFSALQPAKRESIPAAGCCPHPKTFKLEVLPQEFAYEGRFVDDKNSPAPDRSG